MPHPPEIELLLLCARPQLNAGVIGRIRSVLGQEVDWRVIFKLATEHRIIPLLAFHLHEHATDLLSSDIQSELQELHRNSTQHNLILAMELLRLIGLLTAGGTQVVPFKGPVSAILSYGDMAMRACGDIDLLVRPNDHDKAERLLGAEGYSVTERYQNAMQSTLWHEQRQIYVDMHWGIPPGNLRLNSDYLWQDLEQINLLGRPVLTFSPCDTLLVMAINATKEYWRPSLHHLSEIAALTGNYTDRDWMTAFHRAQLIGCQRMLVAATLFAHRLLDIALPSVGPGRLFNHRDINRVVDELQDHLFPGPGEQDVKAAMQLIHHANAQRYYLSLTDSWPRRCSDWLQWAFTPNRADRAVIKLPRQLSLLYYFIRPLRLLVKRR